MHSGTGQELTAGDLVTYVGSSEAGAWAARRESAARYVVVDPAANTGLDLDAGPRAYCVGVDPRLDSHSLGRDEFYAPHDRLARVAAPAGAPLDEALVEGIKREVTSRRDEARTAHQAAQANVDHFAHDYCRWVGHAEALTGLLALLDRPDLAAALAVSAPVGTSLDAGRADFTDPVECALDPQGAAAEVDRLSALRDSGYLTAQTEPVAWGVLDGHGSVFLDSVKRNKFEAEAYAEKMGGRTVVPLYASPQAAPALDREALAALRALAEQMLADAQTVPTPDGSTDLAAHLAACARTILRITAAAPSAPPALTVNLDQPFDESASEIPVTFVAAPSAPPALPHGLVVSEDGGLLNWQGENYVRQPSAPPVLDPAAEGRAQQIVRNLTVLWGRHHLSDAERTLVGQAADEIKHLTRSGDPHTALADADLLNEDGEFADHATPSDVLAALSPPPVLDPAQVEALAERVAADIEARLWGRSADLDDVVPEIRDEVRQAILAAAPSSPVGDAETEPGPTWEFTASIWERIGTLDVDELADLLDRTAREWGDRVGLDVYSASRRRHPAPAPSGASAGDAETDDEFDYGIRWGRIVSPSVEGLDVIRETLDGLLPEVQARAVVVRRRKAGPWEPILQSVYGPTSPAPSGADTAAEDER